MPDPLNYIPFAGNSAEQDRIIEELFGQQGIGLGLSAVFVTQGTQSISVKDSAYGATGLGVADDTVAIQTALNVAGVLGGEVVLPPGTYIVTNLLIPSGVTFRGVSRFACVLSQKAGATGRIVTNKTPGTDTNITIERLWVHAFNNQANNGGGIILEGASFSRVQECQATFTRGYSIQVLGHGLDTSGDAMHCTIMGNLVQNLVAGVGIGATPSVNGSHPDTVRILYNTVNSAVGTGIKVDAQASGQLPVGNPVIMGNRTQECPIPLDICAFYAVVEGNWFEVTSGTMTVTIQAGPASGHSNGCIFIGNTYATYGTPSALTFTDNSTDGCTRIGDVTAGGIINRINNHLMYGGSVPALSGVNAGFSASSIVGNDTRGVITLTTGLAPPGAFNNLIRVTFATPYPVGVTPVIMLTEQDATGGYGQPNAFNVDNTGFNLTTTGAFGASNTYHLGYAVFG